MLRDIENEDNNLLNITSNQQINILAQNDEIVLSEGIFTEYNSGSKLNDTTSQKFYNFPRYYEKAFDRDIVSDVLFFEQCFQQYSDVKVERVLEPACGPGMFLELLPKYGFYIVGYDLSPAMVEYTREKLRASGITIEQADILEGNMKNMKFDRKFEAAFTCINSLGYLRSNEDISSHFRVMAESLKTGGIYIVEISCKCDNIINEKKFDDTWYVKENDIELELTWAINWYDIEHRIRHVDFRMLIKENGNEILVEEAHELRLWIFEEFREFVRVGGFEITGIFNQNYELISEQEHITGELGVLYFVLKKK